MLNRSIVKGPGVFRCSVGNGNPEPMIANLSGTTSYQEGGILLTNMLCSRLLFEEASQLHRGVHFRFPGMVLQHQASVRLEDDACKARTGPCNFKSCCTHMSCPRGAGCRG